MPFFSEHSARRRASIARDREHDCLFHWSHQRAIAETRGMIKQARQDYLKKVASIFDQAEPFGTVENIIFLLTPFAVFFVNYLLINGSVKFIASIPFDVGPNQPDPWQANLATFVFPCLLILLEIGVYIARRKTSPKGTHHLNVKDLWFWVGAVLITITPLLIIGMIVAVEPKYFTPDLFTNYLTILILAVVVDTIIVFGGEFIYKSLAFVNYHLEQWSLQRDINYFQRKQHRAERQIQRSWRRFHQISDHYNARYPERPLDPGMFSELTITQVNASMGFGAIQRSPNTFSGNDSTPAAPVDSPPSPNGDAAEADYYEQLRQDQIRRNEREVQPD